MFARRMRSCITDASQARARRSEPGQNRMSLRGAHAVCSVVKQRLSSRCRPRRGLVLLQKARERADPRTHRPPGHRLVQTGGVWTRPCAESTNAAYRSSAFSEKECDSFSRQKVKRHEAERCRRASSAQIKTHRNPSSVCEFKQPINRTSAGRS